MIPSDCTSDHGAVSEHVTSILLGGQILICILGAHQKCCHKHSTHEVWSGPRVERCTGTVAPWAFSTNCCTPAVQITLHVPDTRILLTRTYSLVLHSLTLPPPPHQVRQDTFPSIYTPLTKLLQQNFRVRDRKTLLCLSL